MEWLSLSVNPPEKVKPIVARTEDKFGWGVSYRIIDFDCGFLSVDEAIQWMQTHSLIEWKYIESEDYV